jgi:hypothetical protein
MRKAVCVTMAAFFIFTVITGIAESHIHPGRSGSHTVIAVIFIVSTSVHILINRKAFFRYFSGKTLKAGQPTFDENK